MAVEGLTEITLMVQDTKVEEAELIHQVDQWKQHICLHLSLVWTV